MPGVIPTAHARKARHRAALLFLAVCSLLSLPAWCRERWSEPQANAWYGRLPWLVGANYIPANAINQLEMWQADTFSGLAESS